MDITPDERYILSSLRRRPGMYLGTKSFAAFVAWQYGYNHALSMTKQPQEQHNLLPDGLYEYAAKKYLGDDNYRGPLGWMSLISSYQPDDKLALDEFFVFLDEYLITSGFEPIPDWDTTYANHLKGDIKA